MKLHVAIDQQSGKLFLAALTKETSHDTSCVEKALRLCNRRKGKVLFDGIADSKRCYELCERYNKVLLTLPGHRAILRQKPGYGLRNEALKQIKRLGGDEPARSLWAKRTGYSRRSEIESTISRWKKVLGADLKSKNFKNIYKEVRIKAEIYNTLIELRQAK
jgi:hypothetical protein